MQEIPILLKDDNQHEIMNCSELLGRGAHTRRHSASSSESSSQYRQLPSASSTSTVQPRILRFSGSGKTLSLMILKRRIRRAFQLARSSSVGAVSAPELSLATASCAAWTRDSAPA
jgi:hypothetical protein